MKSLIPQLCWANSVSGNSEDFNKKPPIYIEMVSQAKLNIGGGPNGQ